MLGKLTRRSFLRHAALAAGAASLAACAQAAPQVVEKVVKETVLVEVEKEVTVQPAAEEIIHLRYLETPSRDLKGIAGLCQRYSEERDGKVVVDIIATPEGRWGKMTMMHMAGDPADLTQWGLDIIDLAIRDVILKLDPLLERDGIDLESIFIPMGTEACKFTTWGLMGYYGVPLYVNPKFIIYNKAILDEAAVPALPTTAAEAWTCEQYAEYAVNMTDEDSGRWGTNDMDIYWTNTPSYFNGFSFNEGASKVLWDERAALGMQWCTDLINDYRCAPSTEQAQMLGGGEIFLTGQVGMAMASGWSLVALRDIEEFEWAVGMLPFTGDGQPYRAGNNEPNVWAIDSAGKHIDESWDFIKWITIENNVDQCKVYGSLSPSREGNPELMQWYSDEYGIDTTAFVETLEHGCLTGDNLWDNPNWADAWNAVQPHWDELKLGRITGKEFIEVSTPELERLLNQTYADRTPEG